MPPLPSLDRTREGEPGPAAGEQRPERPLCTGGTHRGETGPRCAGIAGLGGAGLWGWGSPERPSCPLHGAGAAVPPGPVPAPAARDAGAAPLGAPGAGPPTPPPVPLVRGRLPAPSGGPGARRGSPRCRCRSPRPMPARCPPDARCPCRLLLPPVPAGGAGRGRSDAISAKSGPGLNAGRPEKRNWRRRRVPGPPRVPPARRRR